MKYKEFLQFLIVLSIGGFILTIGLQYPKYFAIAYIGKNFKGIYIS